MSTLTDAEITAAYTGAWLPRKVIDQPARDCFRKWRDWQGDTAINGVIEREEKRLDLRAKLERAYLLARLYGRAHVYFDMGDDPSQPLLVERVKKGQLRFATVLSRREIADGDIDDDPLSPYFGLPKYYALASPSAGFVNIHPSRLVTFWGDESPQDMVFGRRGYSVMQAAMPAIKRHDSTVANVAGLVFEARVDVITVPDLGALMQDSAQSQAILDRFRLMATMKGNNGMVLLSGSANKDVLGETWESKPTTFATLPDIIEKAQEEVSAASGIPRAILFGASGGGLGSTGDMELSSYYDNINSMQSNDIEPAMAILDECLIRSALGSRPDVLWYSWASLWQMSDKEKAEVAAKITESGVKMGTMGFPVDVVVPSVASALVEAGLFPGLEAALKDYTDANGETFEPDADEGDLPEGNGNDTQVIDHWKAYKSPEAEAVKLLGDYLAITD
jgi:phage-related protein (TIGR01555 family)